MLLGTMKVFDILWKCQHTDNCIKWKFKNINKWLSTLVWSGHGIFYGFSQISHLWPPFFILLIDGSSWDLSGDKGFIRVPLLLELLLNLKYVFLDKNRDLIYTDFTPMCLIFVCAFLGRTFHQFPIKCISNFSKVWRPGAEITQNDVLRPLPATSKIALPLESSRLVCVTLVRKRLNLKLTQKIRFFVA
jgi:hypothetical protein